MKSLSVNWYVPTAMLSALLIDLSLHSSAEERRITDAKDRGSNPCGGT